MAQTLAQGLAQERRAMLGEAVSALSEPAKILLGEMTRWAAPPHRITVVDESFVGGYLGLDRLVVRHALRELEDANLIDRAGGAMYSVAG